MRKTIEQNLSRRSSLKTRWNPMQLNTFYEKMAELANCVPGNLSIQNNEIRLLFPNMAPGQTIQTTIPSRAGRWAITDMQVTERISTEHPTRQQLLPLSNITVSSYIMSDNETMQTITEEQPVSMIFGTGEWTASGFLSLHESVDRRIYALTNNSEHIRSIVLGFRVLTILKRA